VGKTVFVGLVTQQAVLQPTVRNSDFYLS